MIKILEIGEKPEDNKAKDPMKVTCPYCQSVLAFRREEVWIDTPALTGKVDQPNFGIGRIECPVCRNKIHMTLNVTIQDSHLISEEDYESAIVETSKSGLQELIEEKRKQK